MWEKLGERKDLTTHVGPSSPLTHILRTRERANDLERKDLKVGRRERKMCCPSGRKKDKGGWSNAVKIHGSCSQKTQSTYVENGAGGGERMHLRGGERKKKLP